MGWVFWHVFALSIFQKGPLHILSYWLTSKRTNCLGSTLAYTVVILVLFLVLHSWSTLWKFHPLSGRVWPCTQRKWWMSIGDQPEWEGLGPLVLHKWREPRLPLGARQMTIELFEERGHLQLCWVYESMRHLAEKGMVMHGSWWKTCGNETVWTPCKKWPPWWLVVDWRTLAHRPEDSCRLRCQAVNLDSSATMVSRTPTGIKRQTCYTLTNTSHGSGWDGPERKTTFLYARGVPSTFMWGVRRSAHSVE